MQTLKELFSMNLTTFFIVMVLALIVTWNSPLFWLFAGISISLISLVSVFIIGLILQGKITGGASFREAVKELWSEIKSLFSWRSW